MSLSPRFYVITLFRLPLDEALSAKLLISNLVTEIRHFLNISAIL